MTISRRTLLSYLAELAAASPEKKLLGGPDGWLEAGRLLTLVNRAGAAFRRLGLGAGDTVAFRATRRPESAVLILGLRAAGAVAALCDPKQDLGETLNGADTPVPVRALIQPGGGTAFQMVWPVEERKKPVKLDLSALSPEGAGEDIPSVSSTDPAFVIFTSGSTGKSKAVVLSESNLVNNLIDSQPLGDYRPEDRALGALPLHHVFGLVLLAGAAVLGYGVYYPEKTDVPAILSAIQAQRLTRMNGVPSLYLAMADQRGGYDLSSMRAGFIGGGPVTAEQFARIEETLGMTLISVYGMSEFVGISCASALDSREIRASGVGRFYSMNAGKILREDGTEAAPGETGEICALGPARMVGYLGRPMAPDEWLPTGDLGYLDEGGVLHLTGRKKDIIIRNGNNLSPRKIEQALLTVPGVRAAAVVGLPDDRQGEAPAAMVAADRDDLPLDDALPKNERPVLYLFVDALPLTASGKPDRRAIRETLLRLWRQDCPRAQSNAKKRLDNGVDLTNNRSRT